MRDSFSGKARRAYTWLRCDQYRIYFIAVCLLAIGGVLVAFSPEIEGASTLLASMSSNFGIALITAGVLMAGVERYLKERLFAEIKGDFDNTLDSFAITAFDLQQFGRLPPPLRERLRSRVLRAPVIQRDVSYQYQLEPVANEGVTSYKGTVTASSTYVNLTTETQSFLVKEALPKGSEGVPGDHGFRKITSNFPNGGGEFPSEMIPQGIANHISTKSGSIFFEREATLDPDSALTVTFESIAYLDQAETISLEAFLPTLRMACTTSGRGLVFEGQSGEAVSDMWEVKSAAAHETHWELGGAILPGQGFDVWFVEDENAGLESSVEPAARQDDQASQPLAPNPAGE